MNEDAEKWLAKYSDPLGPFIDVDTLREAMRFAYSDAARICTEHGKGIEYGDEYETFVSEENETVMACAREIQERMK